MYEDESSQVGEDMAGVAEKGQAVGQDAAEYLQHKDAHRDSDGEQQATLRRGSRRDGMCVLVWVRMVM